MLAIPHHQIVGTGAIKRLSSDTCELKRFFIDKSYRAQGLGLKLMRELLAFAQAQSYKAIRLQIHFPEKQQRAITFYKKFGFHEIEPYDQGKEHFSMEMAINYPEH